MRILRVAGIWLIAFAAAFGLLHVIDEGLDVPGAHAAVDAGLALFASLPIAILTATTIVARRQVAGPRAGRPLLSGRRATAIALAALAVEAVLVLAVELRPLALLQWGVFVAWVGVMAAAGGRLAEVLGGLD